MPPAPQYATQHNTWSQHFKWFRYRIKSVLRYGHWDFFSDFNIEINTSCNRRCTYCPNSIFDRGALHNERLLDEAIYYKLIDELAEIRFRGRISPQLYGEPLLDKRLPRLMRYTRGKLPKVRIVLISNGDALGVDQFENLLAAGVNRFSLTQHGPIMSATMCELFAYLADRPDRQRLVSCSRFDETTPLYNRGGLVHPPVVNTTPRCADPANPVAIDADGNVILCCHDYHSTVIFGNLGEQSLRDIWFDPRYRTLRRELRQRRYRLPICKRCIGQE
ncbi:MAG: radical SAM/SPASM domain-containing protein [Desulfobulbus sp.]|jgi:cyclic pyranopterin phosphate synthase